MAFHSLTSRQLIAIAANPTCQRLIRLRMLGVSDQEGYHLLTGEALLAESGERLAALRHGRQFERHLVENHAAALLYSLRHIAPFNPHAVRILDVEAEAHAAAAHPIKHAVALTERALRDATRQQSSPDILLQPALKLSRARWGTTIVRPDALVLDRGRNRYWPLEAKAYPAIDGWIEPAERRSMRLQAAVQLIALQDATGSTQPESDEALLVVASPFGFKPEPAILERLDAEVRLITRAIDAINEACLELKVQPEVDRRASLLRDARRNPRESCLDGCGLVGFCRAEQPGFHTALGDMARQILPPSGGHPDYLDELRTRAPELHAVWQELAVALGWENEHGPVRPIPPLARV